MLVSHTAIEIWRAAIHIKRNYNTIRGHRPQRWRKFQGKKAHFLPGNLIMAFLFLSIDHRSSETPISVITFIVFFFDSRNSRWFFLFVILSKKLIRFIVGPHIFLECWSSIFGETSLIRSPPKKIAVWHCCGLTSGRLSMIIRSHVFCSHSTSK